MANILTAGNSSNGGTAISTDTSGTLNIVTGSGSGATAISVDASQATTFAAGVSGTTGSFSGNMSFNSGYGSAAVAYGCRAWVNFNGTGTVAIRASGNVTSITDNGTGDYTVNFTTAMPDANYSATHGQGPRSVAPFCSVYVSNTSSTYSFQTINTITGAVADASIVFVAIVR
jgi:hypothetical protein